MTPDHLCDDELLREAYANHHTNPVVAELCKRLERAHEKLEAQAPLMQVLDANGVTEPDELDRALAVKNL